MILFMTLKAWGRGEKEKAKAGAGAGVKVTYFELCALLSRYG